MPLGVSRYLLPVFLPLVIIIVNDVKNFFNAKTFRQVITTGLIITAIWGILCSYTDYTFAGIYKEFSEKIGREYKDRNVWFSGDGLKVYMEKKGYRSLLHEGEKPMEGDIVILTSELWPYRVRDVMERVIVIDRVSYESKFPIRTMNLPSHAGFHDHLSGALLPFSITRGRYEEFIICEVTK
jgi:hypothetical protein